MIHPRSQVLALAVIVGASCNDANPPAQSQADLQGPAPRDGDPPLSHTWTMSADASVIAQGDLGTKPEGLGEALMAKVPGITHRIAKACADKGVLPRPGTVVLRLTLGESGLEQARGDPPGPAADCLVAAIRGESEALADAPAGAALIRLQFHPAG